MQIFSVILLALSVLVTIVPFVIWWRTEALKIFLKFGKKEKEVSGWVILSYKIILIVILGIIFIFAFPSKVMLNPTKCVLFAAILLGINIILAFLQYYEEKENSKEKVSYFVIGTYIICLIFVFGGMLFASSFEEKNLPPIQEVVDMKITNIDDKTVYYIDESGNLTSIKLDDKVVIQYSEEARYVRRKKITKRYIRKFDKVQKVYSREPYYEYEVHIPN